MRAIYKRLRLQVASLQTAIAEKDEELRKSRERNGRLRKKNRELREAVAFLEALAGSGGREVERLRHELACATGTDASHYADGM